MTVDYPTSPDEPVRGRNILLRPFGAWQVLLLFPGLTPWAILSRHCAVWFVPIS